jgi:hypothetical protein
LIEMLMGKGPSDFAKHLPEAARQTLIRKGETPETSVVLRISTIGHELASQGGHLETFDTGPNILVSEAPGGHDRVEVVVEHDSFFGDGDEIELSVQVYKDGQLQSLPVVPRLTFTLKQEKEIWKLTEVTAAAHIPLTDPDYLKGLRKEQDETYEMATRSRMTMMSQAETHYAASHPAAGYTCKMASLFPQDRSGESSTPDAVEEMNGYRFALAGCSGRPASRYQLTATPIDSESELKAYCIDESGTLKSISGSDSSSCLSDGLPVEGQPASGGLSTVIDD